MRTFGLVFKKQHFLWEIYIFTDRNDVFFCGGYSVDSLKHGLRPVLKKYLQYHNRCVPYCPRKNMVYEMIHPQLIIIQIVLITDPDFISVLQIRIYNTDMKSGSVIRIILVDESIRTIFLRGQYCTHLL